MAFALLLCTMKKNILILSITLGTIGLAAGLSACNKRTLTKTEGSAATDAETARKKAAEEEQKRKDAQAAEAAEAERLKKANEKKDEAEEVLLTCRQPDLYDAGKSVGVVSKDGKAMGYALELSFNGGKNIYNDEVVIEVRKEEEKDMCTIVVKDNKEEENFTISMIEEGKDTLVNLNGEELNLTMECELSCLLYTSPSPRDRTRSRMPSSA